MNDSPTLTLGYRVRRELWHRFTDLVAKKHGKAYGFTRDELEKAIQRYVEEEEKQLPQKRIS